MSTITVRYWGGMGNVLFQIAAAIAYSNKLNRPFVLSKYPAFPNLENCSASSIGITEEEYLESLIEFNEDEIQGFTESVGRGKSAIFTGRKDDVGVLHENANGVQFPVNQNIKLIGFFQDYRLFDEYKEQLFAITGIPVIRQSVIPIIELPAFVTRGLFLSDCETEITVSLHIRRGDYEQLACYFLLLNQYYYKNALLHIANKLLCDGNNKKIKILCFYEKKTTASCRKVIDALLSDHELAKYPFEYHHFNELIEENLNRSVTDIEELAIMSQCKHHIIANSTYSWWSAYMNPDPNKIVCYPNEYFNHQLYYLVNDGLKVKEWTSITAWNPLELRCECHRQ